MGEAANPPHLQYALVAYVRSSLGRFVEGLRSDLYPEHAHLPAHVTVLPPRELRGTEAEAVEVLSQLLQPVEAFRVELGEVETFCPTTPTVFLRVSRSAHRFREMHDALNVGPLHHVEQWPYMPHLTIVKMPQMHQADIAREESRQRWADYRGERSAIIEELTFVRSSDASHWTDLFTFRLKAPQPAPLR